MHQGADRQLLAGYCNGDLRLFDLRAGTERWSTNLGSGVIGVDFDRPDIDMNKFVAVCMNSVLHAADARTQHSTKVTLASLVDDDVVVSGNHWTPDLFWPKSLNSYSSGPEL